MRATHIPMVASVSARLAALGLDVDVVAARAGIPAGFNRRPGTSLDTRQFFAFWRAVAELSGDPLIGLKIGGEVGPSQLEAVSVAALHSATFGDALARLARYKGLCCPEEVRVERDGENDLARLSFHWILAKEPCPRIISDAAFAAAHALARVGTGQTVVPRRMMRGDRPTIDTLARELNMSARSLLRRCPRIIQPDKASHPAERRATAGLISAWQ
jgi:hypothetical protein